MARRGRFTAGPVARLTLVMSCVFCGNGMALPFLGRWLEGEHGLNGVQIAAVVSSAQLLRIGVGPLFAAWADGFADRRIPPAMFVCASLGCYVLFFRVDGFAGLLVTSFLAQTFSQAMVPLVEGAILRRSITGGGMSYGVARGIGSVAFTVANVLGGVMVARYGVGVVAIWLLTSMTAAAASAVLVLSPDPAPATSADTGFRARLRAALALFRNPAFATSVAAASFIQCGHAFYYGFSTLVWVRQGLSDAVIGWLWAFGVIVEIALLWTLPRFERRFAPEALIALGGAGGLIRWTALAFMPPASLLWPLQALHALSFAAAHVGAMKLVQREAPLHVAGLAQTLYAALAYGTFAGLSMLLAGALYDRIGARGYLAMALFSGVGLALMLTLGRTRLSGAPGQVQTPPPQA